jgi:DNA/RNA-binding domain of Phe-tRNA-synthetase-like protein
MRRWLWRDACNNVVTYETGNVVVHAIICVVAVYMVCTIIDMLRIRFVEGPVLKYLEKELTINERKS